MLSHLWDQEKELYVSRSRLVARSIAIFIALAGFFPHPRAFAQTVIPTNISGSTATGIALSATAVYKLGNDNQWPDYERVVIIATLQRAGQAFGQSSYADEHGRLFKRCRKHGNMARRPETSGSKILCHG